jgi:magnesium transporter
MADTADNPLSLAFMRGHPAPAARVLEALAPAAAAAVFARAPARVGADVLAAMVPHRAAQCLAALEAPRMLELLSAMATQPAVALLRQLQEPLRQRLLAGLPTAAALASTLLLGYADDSLGAAADPGVLMLGADTRATDALARVRAEPPAHPLLFVADGERRLAGVVGLAALLNAPEQATLATLMRPPPAVLAAHASLASAAAHPGWLLTSVMPVLAPGQRLVGVLSRDALERLLQQVAAAPAAGEGDLAALLARGYWQAISGLIGGALALLPPVSRVPAGPTRAAARGAADDER